ncbi:HD-GYP domain-containing protein [Terriglobus roseus]|uniref:HDIG domain-containing protein n=1 Tax=Terriglobus roseus TaxID=392734 RepID=A0A1G7P9T6_9BACT|nr:HD-GYP domain-containing protein [Terriglobus roseus]SDF83033.1 HDIG domain-containing protein [Terriglobus roseus]
MQLDTPNPAMQDEHRQAAVLKFPSRPAVFSELVAGLTDAFDLGSGEHSGHTLRTCVLGMNLGRNICPSQEWMNELYYALLLKDVGTTSNTVDICERMGMEEHLCRQALRVFDWTKITWPQIRFVFRHSFRDRSWPSRLKPIFRLLRNRRLVWQSARPRAVTSELIARKVARSEATIDAIRCVDERWDGSGGPAGLKKHEIPLMAQTCSIAQTLESLDTLLGRDEAVRIIEARSGTWFDPGLVALVIIMHEEGTLWNGADTPDLMREVISRDPDPDSIACDYDAFENICSAFADMIDAKSHYTFMHSQNVAMLTEAIARQMHLPEDQITSLRRAALLHDIGMLGISNAIMDKEGPLTQQQWSSVREHAQHSYNLLCKVRGFEDIARIARDHHERLDGSGYPQGLTAADIDLPTRILSVADVYDAICSPRPYRNNLEPDTVLRIMETLTPHLLDADCVAALKNILMQAKHFNIVP